MGIAYAICLAFLGLILGSFAGAQVWRLRARQLAEDKKLGEQYNKAEYKKLAPLLGKKKKQDRSLCLHCGHKLTFKDLIPLASWLSTRGKCRYCHKKIGFFEPVIEITMAIVFVLSFIFWPGGVNTWQQVILFAIWCISLVILAMLVAYDLKWRLLPDALTLSFGVMGLIFTAVRFLFVGSVSAADLTSLALAVMILSGIYGVLYVISKGKWIGLGDVKLGVGLGLILGTWQGAFIALFLANLIGCLVVLPGIVSKKLRANSEIAFGPLLALGMFISFFASETMVQWFLNISLL